MTKTKFRTKWEDYFRSFTDEQLFAIHFLISDMHKNGKWFEYVGKVTDAWVKAQRNKEKVSVKTTDTEVVQEQQAVH